MPRWRQAEEQARRECHAGRDAQDTRVEPDGFEARQVRRNELWQEIETECGHSEASCAAESGEQQTLRQQLAEHADTASAQRGTHRQFLLASLRARQLEVGDVGGGNDQHERDSAQQQAQGAVHFRRAEHFAQVAALELVFSNRAFFGLTLREYIEKSLHLGCLDFGPHFRNDPGICQPIVSSWIRMLGRPPVFVVAGHRKGKVRRHDAHHCHGSFAKANRATNYGWIAAKQALP